MIPHEPIRFIPIYKSVIWGGTRIAALKSATLQDDHIGESWELSGVPGSVSVVAEGPFAGRDINSLSAELGVELLGTRATLTRDGRFPVLVKFIDAHANLSLQVHPGDELARRKHGCDGKTEAWYVVEAAPDARIYVGLASPLDRDSYQAKLQANSLMDSVNAFRAERGQFYMIPAGTLHAIGSGNLLVEVQQCSDITYRVYDYNRRDKDGNLRQLHTEAAAEAINYDDFPYAAIPTARVFDGSNPSAVSCPHFNIDYIDLMSGSGSAESERQRDVSTESCAIIINVGADARLLYEGRETEIRRGETLLLPAGFGQYSISGGERLLIVTLCHDGQ